jgi:acetyltransferase-like isoleucine patch superfamily enzyme
MKKLLWFIEDSTWNIRCGYNYWLHGPYGLCKVIEKIPNRFLIKYLRKFGASIGSNCLFERGINIHRPFGRKPFENLIIGNNVYLGHNTLIDLTRKVELKNRVIIASRCQIWTHASYYGNSDIDKPNYGEYFGEVMINEGAIIYSNTIVMHGITIERFSRIGANSLVNKTIPGGEFWGGVPVKKIEKTVNS